MDEKIEKIREDVETIGAGHWEGINCWIGRDGETVAYVDENRNRRAWTPTERHEFARFLGEAPGNLRFLLEQLDEETARTELFGRCLHRAQIRWKEAHPDSDYWPDGADNIVWLLERLEDQEEANKNMEDILDHIWGLLYPGEPQGWEYPGQVLNHIRVELEHRGEIEKLLMRAVRHIAKKRGEGWAPRGYEAEFAKIFLDKMSKRFPDFKRRLEALGEDE